MARHATKIVATLGPASSDPALLEAMIRAGVNVVRLNFSHGKAQDHIDRAHLVREALLPPITVSKQLNSLEPHRFCRVLDGIEAANEMLPIVVRHGRSPLLLLGMPRHSANARLAARRLDWKVLHVLLAGSEAKMKRVDTNPVSTSMLDIHTMRDGARKQFIRKPMGANRSAVTGKELAVSMRCQRCCP